MMTDNEKNPDDKSVLTTKHSIRRKVWDYLEKNHLVNFPRPVFGRIPNFKGCEEAAIKVTELDVFKQAQNIKVNPDKPQEPVRFSVLEYYKNLFVPVPRLASGLLKRINLPEKATKNDIQKLVSRRGIEECGKEIGLDHDTKIDLVILGSVAVSSEGYRIAKGKGYADLEFAILSQMKAVNPNTVVITTVHDSQVFDSFPKDIFGPHDVPVDIIVTPTRVIYVVNKLPKPEGIIWAILTEDRIELMPVLKALREEDELAGKDVTLRELDPDVENRPPFNRFRRARYRHRQNRQNVDAAGDVTESGDKDKEEQKNRHRRRRIIRRKYRKEQENTDTDKNVNSCTTPQTSGNDSPESKRRPHRSIRKNRSVIDFSLVIRNIEKNVRVRDLKAALAERGIKPNLITWRGMKGYCCLHFSKTNPNTISDPEQNSHGVDNVLGMLQNLSINVETNKPLSIEIMKPVSRIETTDVTAV